MVVEIMLALAIVLLIARMKYLQKVVGEYRYEVITYATIWAFIIVLLTLLTR